MCLSAQKQIFGTSRNVHKITQEQNQYQDELQYTGCSGLTGERGSWSVECILCQQTVISSIVQRKGTSSITRQIKQEKIELLKYVILDCRVSELT